MYLFLSFIILVFLFLAFHFPIVFCHYKMHFSEQLVTTLFPISKTIAFSFVCVFLFHSVLLLPTSTIASLPPTLDLHLSRSSFNDDRFMTVRS